MANHISEPNLNLCNGLSFSGELDQDKDMEITLGGGIAYINGTEAEAIVKHLIQVFGI